MFYMTFLIDSNITYSSKSPVLLRLARERIREIIGDSEDMTDDEVIDFLDHCGHLVEINRV